MIVFEKHISNNDELLSATDLIMAGNRWRAMNLLHDCCLPRYLMMKSTKAFIKELKEDHKTVLIVTRKRELHTWFHPLLFIDFLLYINPTHDFKGDVLSLLIKYIKPTKKGYNAMTVSLVYRMTCRRYKNKMLMELSVMIKGKGKTNKIYHAINKLCGIMQSHEQCIRIGIEKHEIINK